MNLEYINNGYFVLKNIFDKAELAKIKDVLQVFHSRWKVQNSDFYLEKAINSAYITNAEFLTDEQRKTLFELIGSTKVMDAVLSAIPNSPCFLNTQLFFDPVNPAQKNYWHRDPQYHLNLEEQEAALCGPEVVHLRIPLVNEPGIELVPGSHRRWDTREELDIRLEQKGHKSWEQISTGQIVALNAGDLLVFSANMIHRGIYGMDRFALDILFCDPDPNVITFVNDNCLPEENIRSSLQNPDVFMNTINLKKATHHPLKL